MSRVNLGLHQNDVSVVWDLGPHDFSILRYWLGENPVRVSAIGRELRHPRTAPTSRSSTSSSRPARSPTSSSPGSLRASSGARRSSAREKMIVYDDTSNEPVRIFDSGVDFRDPESFGEYQLSYRTGDIVSPRLEASEPLLLEMLGFLPRRSRRRAAASNGQLGVEIVQVIEAVEALAGAWRRAGSRVAARRRPQCDAPARRPLLDRLPFAVVLGREPADESPADHAPRGRARPRGPVRRDGPVPRGVCLVQRPPLSARLSSPVGRRAAGVSTLKAAERPPVGPRHALPNRVNAKLHRAARAAGRARRSRQPVVLWIYDPTAAGLIGSCGEAFAVYDCVDDYASLASTRPAEQALAARRDRGGRRRARGSSSRPPRRSTSGTVA